ncbi:MAG: hypothetical protein AAFZ18_17725 [Myxococcota bacterium]
MEIVVIAALAAAGVGLVMPLKDVGVRERWRVLAERLGLAFVPGRLLESDGMEGQFGPHPVRIDNQRRSGTRVAVTLGPKLRSLRVQPRHLWFFEGGERKDDRLDVPPALSALLRQVGLARLFLLLLDPAQEARLDQGVYSAHIWIEGGELAFSCPERIDDPDLLGTVLGGLARLAEALEAPPRLAEALGESARAPHAPLRRKLTCLQLLLEHQPESSEGGRAAWSILQAPQVATPDGLRLQLLALRHLHSTQARSELLPVLDDALARPSPGMRLVAVEGLLAVSAEQAVPRLVAAARDPSPMVAAAALRILPVVARVRPEDSRVERVLLELLYRGEPELRVELVCALATLGTPRCMGPLLDLERIADPALRRACRHALGRLQKRYPERQSGSLSLVGSGGELSLPDKV